MQSVCFLSIFLIIHLVITLDIKETQRSCFTTHDKIMDIIKKIIEVLALH